LSKNALLQSEQSLAEDRTIETFGLLHSQIETQIIILYELDYSKVGYFFHFFKQLLCLVLF